jgi:hypothetical protein
VAAAEADEADVFLRRAASGDESTLPVVREILQTPDLVDAFGGNLAKTLEREVVQRIAGSDLLLRQALLRKLESLRSELAGTDSIPLEHLLVATFTSTGSAMLTPF